jgi:hypothetical protein
MCIEVNNPTIDDPYATEATEDEGDDDEEISEDEDEND